jgi:hypothetical protein
MAFDYLYEPAKWEDQADATPPSQFEADANDGRYWFSSSDPNHVAHIGENELTETLIFKLEIVTAPSSGTLYLQYDNDAAGVTSVEIGTTLGIQNVTVTDHDATAEAFRFGIASANGTSYQGMANGGLVALTQGDTSFNCECEDDPNAKTLSAMRQEVLERLGFAAQAANPPPGMAALVNSVLRSSQEYLHRQYSALRTERFFTWPALQGIRFYDLGANIDACAVKLDPHKITWVGAQQADDWWYPLIEGVPPSYYTVSEQWQGWPQRYEIRQCLEVFPAPDANVQKIRIKGRFLVNAFASDTDLTSIDPEPVFLWALATAKRHFGQPDANDYFQMARDTVAGLVAGAHGTARYVPRKRELPPMTPPTMTSFIE